MKTWRFIRSGFCSPAENMAIDEAILLAHSKGEVPPTMRFYRWESATLSIGYFQKADDEVDFEALHEQGIGFVRRPTGGRAVLHDQELTYSMIVSESYPGMPRSVTEAYRVLSEGLLQGFRQLGLQAEMVNLGTEEEKNKYAAEMTSAACFDSPSWYELVVEGRKVAGSAQMRHAGVILQHGSILLELDTEQLFSLLKFPSERVRERLKMNFVKRAVAINDILRSLDREATTLEQVENAFEIGIAKGLSIRLEESELTPFEKETALQLVQEKYANDNWNFRR